MMRKRAKAEITVFLALSFVLVASLILASVETVRMQATGTYLKTATDSAMDSLYSQYHLPLWEEYRLLGVEMYSLSEVRDEYYGFVKPYADDLLTHNWYTLSVEKEDVMLDEYTLITDQNGKTFEEAVRHFMLQGGVISGITGEEELRESIELLQNAASMQEISEEYSVSTKKVLKLEQLLSKLENEAQTANERRASALSAAAAGNGSGLKRQASLMESTLEKIPGEVSSVRTLAAEIRSELSEKKQLLEEKRNAGEITDESYAMMKTELDDIMRLSGESGQLMQQLEDLEEDTAVDLSILEEVKQKAEEAEEYIRNWVPDEYLVGYDPPLVEGGDPIPIYEEETLNEAAVWAETRECMASTRTLRFSTGKQSVDEQKKRGLKNLQETLSGSFFKLVYPQADTLSKEALALENCPSGKFLGEKTTLLNGDDLLDRFLTDEYAFMKLSNLEPGSGAAGKAEIEYVLAGRQSDYENVSAIVTRLIAVRTGQNLITILKDQGMRAQADMIAKLILGATPAAGFYKALGLLIMTLWANAQGIVDTRRLLMGQSVPIQHTPNSFDLSIEGLLSGSVITLLSETANTGPSFHSPKEIDYQGYLKLFMAASSGSLTDYRIMDVIQMNLRKQQPDFLMERLHVSDTITVKASSRHLFTSVFGNLNGSYQLTEQTSYSY